MYSKEAIKRVASKYKKNIDNLSIEQKQVIVWALVDKIYVEKDDKEGMKMQVIFKFDPENVKSEVIEDELKKKHQ
jgi:hypothetical protein